MVNEPLKPLDENEIEISAFLKQYDLDSLTAERRKALAEALEALPPGDARLKLLLEELRSGGASLQGEGEQRCP
jgi:hypothetical protein